MLCRVDRRAGPTSGRRADPSSLRSPTADRVLALQRSAGNAAVSAALARRTLARVEEGDEVAVLDTRAVAAEQSDPDTADTWSLAGWNDYTRVQADWASQDGFLADPDASGQLRQLTILARSDGGALLSAAGDLLVGELRAAAQTSSQKLVEYGKAVTNYGWTPAPTVADALAWGEAAAKLKAGLTEKVVKDTVKQGALARNVEELIQFGAVDDYVAFVTTTHPLLSATNGKEIASFLDLRDADKASWRTYHGTVGPIVNLHHFTATALEALKTNAASKSRAKPLAVILHATVDHDGAFHRDAEIARVAASAFSTTILIEGAGSLQSAGGSLKEVVAAYGQGEPPKARQILLAGHGNSRMTEVAGTRDDQGELKQESIDLDKNPKESALLIATIIDSLDTDPAARIVLNGCLTAAGSAKPVLERGASAEQRERARETLTNALAEKPSLAATIRALAADKGIKPGQVSAANASIGAEVTLMDPATGELGVRSPKDPLVTSADKFAYLAQAGEATGAGRALVECLLLDPARAEEAVYARLLYFGGSRTEWDEVVITALLLEARDDFADIAFINLAAAFAGDVSELQYPAVAHPRLLRATPVDVFTRLMHFPEQDALFRDQVPPVMQLVAYQVWATLDDKHDQAFLRALSHFTVQAAAPMVEPVELDRFLPELLPAAPGPNAAGELRLALLDVAESGAAAAPASIAYLRARRGGAQFADQPAIVQALGGRSTPEAIIESIKESGDEGPAPDPAYNLDLDGDKVNDFYVEPMMRSATTTDVPLLYAMPDDYADDAGSIEADTPVDVIGDAGDGWYCVEFGPDKKPVFTKDVML